MNDIIKLSNFKLTGCDCNKPKHPECGCHLPPIDLNGYFKVKNLFSELKTEWQKDEARKNLGVTEFKRIELSVQSNEPNGKNVWLIVTEKNNQEKVHEFTVLNGADGKTPNILIGRVESLLSKLNPYVRTRGNIDKLFLDFGIPEGRSAYDLAVDSGFNGTLELWLNSLKGEKGDKGDLGDQGKDGTSGKLIVNVSLIDYGKFTKEFLDNLITANMYIWQIELNTGEKYNIWVPEGINQVVPVGTPTFLYKKVTFQDLPNASDLIDKLSLLQEEVNIDQYTGKSVEVLTTTSNGWSRFSPIIRQPGLEFIYLATSVITSEKVGPWSVTQLTGSLGAQGPQGPEGPQGPAGNSGDEGLGLIGPVIRMRGTWLEDAVPCYQNQSNLAQSGTELRFIDVVFYNDHYWMVSPSHVGCATDRPGTSSLWVQATEFDFAYIDTLIAKYLSAYTIDVEEIRIHDKEENDNNVTTKDIIVAGMTSGKPHNKTEQNNSGTGDDAIRIWAGSNVNVLGATENGKYNLDLEDAKFKVRQNGKLEASDADIEGTIQANILRLGQDSFVSGTDSNNIRILPKLEKNKIQMFYILTDEMTSGVFKLLASDGDKIKYLDTTTLESVTVTSSSIVPLKPKKLYLLFGIDHDLNLNLSNHNLIWHLVELNLAPVETTVTTVDGGVVPASCYSVSYYVIILDIVNNTITGTNVGTLKPTGTIHLTITNNYTSEISVHIADLPLHVEYNEENNYDLTIMQRSAIYVSPGTNFNITPTYEHLTAHSNNYIEVNLENLNSSAPEITLVNTAPTVTLNNGSSGSFVSLNYTEPGKHQYNFSDTLISATY